MGSLRPALLFTMGLALVPLAFVSVVQAILHFNAREAEVDRLLRQAALYEGVPYFIPTLVAGMLTKQGSQDLAVRHLEQAYAVATSEEARTQIRDKLFQLRGSQVAQDLTERQREFQSLMESRYPDFPEAFSLVIGARITSNSILTPPFRPTPHQAESTQ